MSNRGRLFTSRAGKDKGRSRENRVRSTRQGQEKQEQEAGAGKTGAGGRRQETPGSFPASCVVLLPPFSYGVGEGFACSEGGMLAGFGDSGDV